MKENGVYIACSELTFFISEGLSLEDKWDEAVRISDYLANKVDMGAEAETSIQKHQYLQEKLNLFKELLLVTKDLHKDFPTRCIASLRDQ